MSAADRIGMRGGGGALDDRARAVGLSRQAHARRLAAGEAVTPAARRTEECERLTWLVEPVSLTHGLDAGMVAALVRLNGRPLRVLVVGFDAELGAPAWLRDAMT